MGPPVVKVGSTYGLDGGITNTLLNSRVEKLVGRFAGKIRYMRGAAHGRVVSSFVGEPGMNDVGNDVELTVSEGTEMKQRVDFSGVVISVG